jgi:hypothetical protein
MNTETKLSNLAKNAIKDLRDWGGVENVTEEVLLEIFNLPANRAYYLAEIETGYEEAHEYGLDTCVRDDVFDNVSQYYIGETWPIGYETARDFDTFYSNLLSAIEKKA